MSDSHFILCDKYLIKDTTKKDEPAKRLVAILSSNRYGNQSMDNYTFHVQGLNGIEIIAGSNAKLEPLRWYYKDVYKAGLMGGFLGFLTSFIMIIVKNYFFGK